MEAALSDLDRDEVVAWIVEDNDLFREATAELIDSSPGLSCPVAASDCESALEQLGSAAPPDIVLMDIGLPGMDGIAGAEAFARRSPSTRIIMLTVHDDTERIFQAICAGASGYLLKPSDSEQLVEAIHKVQGGAAPINGFIARKLLAMFADLAAPRNDYGLSERETEILQLMVEGLTMKQIADRLDLSYHTIDSHIRNIYAKLHVHSRSGAVAKALQERLLRRPR